MARTGGGHFIEALERQCRADAQPEPPAVKVCGFTIEDEARAACEAGADGLGFNFYPKSKRYVDWKTCISWVSRLPTDVSRIGIFVNEAPERVVEIVASGCIHAAQLHGDESADECAWLVGQGVPIIKALGVKNRDSLQEIRSYSTRWILLDAWCPGEYGGSGKRFDEELATVTIAENPDFSIILSGGLTADNVRSAVRAVNPAAVDVASGVEDTPGRKNIDLVRRFIQEARLIE